MLNQTLETITFLGSKNPDGTKAEDDRRITSLQGVSFYESSGANSGVPATWFPFFGIDERQFVKPIYQDQTFPDDVMEQIRNLPEQYNKRSRSKSFWKCMVYADVFFSRWRIMGNIRRSTIQKFFGK